MTHYASPDFWACYRELPEAVRALTEFAFTQLGLERVHAHHFARNPASGRVLEKAGYTQSRILPANDIIRGIKFNDIEYLFHVQNQ